MSTDLASFSQIGCSSQPGQASKLWESLAGDRLWAGQAGHLKGQHRLGEERFFLPWLLLLVQVLVQARSLAVLGISSLWSVMLSVPVSLGLCSWLPVHGATEAPAGLAAVHGLDTHQIGRAHV